MIQQKIECKIEGLKHWYIVGQKFISLEMNERWFTSTASETWDVFLELVADWNVTGANDESLPKRRAGMTGEDFRREVVGKIDVAYVKWLIKAVSDLLNERASLPLPSES